MFVTNAQGSFASGDNLNGMTLVTILTKLLGLQSNVTPEEPDSIVDKIISQQIPMYSITNEGTLAEVPFNIIDESSTPSESGYYVIKDASDNIVESGYQDISITNDELYYIIALPKEIDYNTMIELKTWDPVDLVWVESKMSLVSDPELVSAMCDEAGVDTSHIDTNKYTIWALEDTCTGTIIRYSIKEEA